MEMEKIENLSGFRLVAFSDEAALRECRAFLNLTQQAVADKAGIPLQSYQQFESGKRKLRRASFHIACKVLEALEMNIAAFHHGDYVFGEQVDIGNGELCFEATGKPVHAEPSENQ